MIIRKIIICIFLVLTFICSCSEKNVTEHYWLEKAKALNDTDPKKAIEYLNKAIQLQQNYADAYIIRGISYVKLNQYQPAIEDLNKAIRLKPDNADAYKCRGYIYFEKGNKNFGCLDAKKACDLGNCQLLEVAKNKGSCR